MQFRKFLLPLLPATLLFHLATAQVNQGSPVLRETARGEQIIVYPDGRWQYFHNYQQGDKTLFDPHDAPKPVQQQEFERYPVFTGQVVPFEQTVPMTEEDARKILKREAQLAASAVPLAEERALSATANRERLETELAKARHGNASEELIRSLEFRLQAARNAEVQSKQDANQALLISQNADQLASKGNYQEVLKSSRNPPGTNNLADSGSETLTGNFYSNIASMDKEFSGPGRQFSALVHPPVLPCRLAFDGIDEHSGMKRRDVQKELLFTFTDERLRLYLKDKDYLRCEGFLTALAGGYRYLSLEFTFAFPNALEAYGFIEKGSYLIINLLDGNSVYLQSGKMDKGSFDTQKELLTYRVHYPMNSNVINTLRKGEVDTIRMYWSSGFEEYEVYNLDFFSNQIRCLEE